MISINSGALRLHPPIQRIYRLPQQSLGQRYCPNCGAVVNAPANELAFCGHCGHAVVRALNLQDFDVEQKSKRVAVLLCIFLGALGVHNFYLGYVKTGIAKLLVFILGFCLAAGPILTAIWSLLELIQILSDALPDARGIPLRDSPRKSPSLKNFSPEETL